MHYICLINDELPVSFFCSLHIHFAHSPLPNAFACFHMIRLNIQNCATYAVVVVVKYENGILVMAKIQSARSTNNEISKNYIAVIFGCGTGRVKVKAKSFICKLLYIVGNDNKLLWKMWINHKIDCSFSIFKRFGVQQTNRQISQN